MKINQKTVAVQVYNEDENTLTLSLRIQSLTEEDYGEYECVSQNLMGRDSERMELYGECFCLSGHSIREHFIHPRRQCRKVW